MRTTKLIIFFSLLAFSLTSFEKKEEEKIAWRSDTRLDWKDFKGKPNKASRNAAMTDSGYGFETGDVQSAALLDTLGKFMDARREGQLGVKIATDGFGICHEAEFFQHDVLNLRRAEIPLLEQPVADIFPHGHGIKQRSSLEDNGYFFSQCHVL